MKSLYYVTALLFTDLALGHVLNSFKISVSLDSTLELGYWECSCKPSWQLDQLQRTGLIKCQNRNSSSEMDESCRYTMNNCFCNHVVMTSRPPPRRLFKRSNCFIEEMGDIEEIVPEDPGSTGSSTPPDESAPLSETKIDRWVASISDLPELKGYIAPEENAALIDEYVQHIADKYGLENGPATTKALDEMVKDAELVFQSIKDSPRVVQPGSEMGEFLPDSDKARVKMPQYLVDVLHSKLLEHVLGDDAEGFAVWTKTPIPEDHAEFIDSLVTPKGRNSGELTLLTIDTIGTMSKNTRRIISQRWLELIGGVFSPDVVTREIEFHETPIKVTFRGFSDAEVKVFAEGAQKQAEYLKKVNDILTDDNQIDAVDQAASRIFGDDGYFSILITRYLALRDIKALTLWKSKASRDAAAVSIQSSAFKTWAPESITDSGEVSPEWAKHPLVWFPKESQFLDPAYKLEDGELDLAEALIHENTHYLFNTIDEEYGYEECIDLAMRDHKTAIKNADSYAWFIREMLKNA